jgi:hypothetical protein
MGALFHPEYLKGDSKAFPAHIQLDFKFDDKNQIICLPMPQNFLNPNTVQWNGDTSLITMDEAGGYVEKFVGKQFENALNEAHERRIRSGNPLNESAEEKRLQEQFNKTRNVSNLIKSASKPAMQAAGVAPNPYLAQIFEGVNFRNFSFSFEFIPFAVKDCEKILEIIKTFRKCSLPKLPIVYSPIVNYPGTVQIQCMFGDGENKRVPKFKECVITNLEINYTGQDEWTMLNNGFPAKTVINAIFSETSIVVKKDIEEGF